MQSEETRVVGIIAEYNPLHTGHIYHMERAKREARAKYCIVVLSGNFVQRGDVACADKYTRAEWAIRAGADLVVELPSVYAVSSAERFALGGVRTLMATGIVTDLAFGCEESDTEILKELSSLLVEEPEEYRIALHRHLKLGKSYPRSRYDALAQIGVRPELLEALTKPNNILALEYLRAIGLYAPEIRPLPVVRAGSSYNSESLCEEFASANAIRNALFRHDPDAIRFLPSFVGGAMLYDETLPLRPDSIDPFVMYALRRLDTNALQDLPDVAEGIENVIAKAARRETGYASLLETVKSKRFTLARLRRIGICALLGIDNGQVHQTVRNEHSEYLKVLALKSSSREVLSLISQKGTAPLIMRNADMAECNSVARMNLRTDAMSSDILTIATGLPIHRDTEGPIII